MTRLKIFVFGANGRLGRELFERLQRDHDVIGFSRPYYGVTESHHIKNTIVGGTPDVVINCTAMNGLEQCAANPSDAIAVNAAAPAIMAGASKSVDALFIHFSTDYVFSGDQLGLYEDTPLKPWGMYGKTKAWGDHSVEACAGAYFIFRLSSLYGRTWTGVLQPVQQVLNGCGRPGQPPVKVLHQWCAPTSTGLVADRIADILARFPRNTWEGRKGTYHLATKQGVWKIDFTQRLLNEIFRNTPSAAGYLWHIEEGVLPEPRPVNTQLGVHKFVRTFGELPDWWADLKTMLPLLPVIPATVTI